MTTSEPTPREIEVLVAYCRYEGQKGAAEHLGIAKSTVRNHLEKLRSRLGVGTTSAAIYVLRDRLP